MPSTPDSRLEEFYVIRVESRRPSRAEMLAADRERFLTANGQPGPMRQARRFATIDKAEEWLHDLGEREKYRYHIQLCTRRKKRQQKDSSRELLDGLMGIPLPYRRTAYNWLTGRDVKAQLEGESPEVYERHHRFLLDHDIDISRPSRVVVMRPKRRRLKINTGRPTDNAPLQFFTVPGQRPSRPDDEAPPATKDGKGSKPEE